MVAREGVEPTTYWVWTSCSNQLSYLALIWWSGRESNSRPHACKACALPTELPPHKKINGREDRNWTCDPLVPNQVLYQAELLPVFGASDRSRTHNPLIRSQILYPIELQTRKFILMLFVVNPFRLYNLVRVKGLEPPHLTILDPKSSVSTKFHHTRSYI